jgi:hypothetical protein
MAMKRSNPGSSLLRERRNLVLGGIQQAAYIAALQRNLIMPLFAWRTGHPGRTLVLDPYQNQTVYGRSTTGVAAGPPICYEIHKCIRALYQRFIKK